MKNPAGLLFYAVFRLKMRYFLKSEFRKVSLWFFVGAADRRPEPSPDGAGNHNRNHKAGKPSPGAAPIIQGPETAGTLDGLRDGGTPERWTPSEDPGDRHRIETDTRSERGNAGHLHRGYP